MRRAITLGVAISAVISLFLQAGGASNAGHTFRGKFGLLRQMTLESLPVGSQPMMLTSFAENKGQWDDNVKFRAIAGDATVWFTTDGIYYQFTRRIAKPDMLEGDELEAMHDRIGRKFDCVEQLVVRASFLDASTDLEIVGEELMPYKCNYCIGNDPANWHTDVQNYEAITIRDIYEGISVRFSSDENGALTYEYVIAPDAEERKVRIEYEESEGILRIENGAFTSGTSWGIISGILSPPKADSYTAEGRLHSMHLSNHCASGEGMPNGRAANAVSLIYSTYLGGNGDDYGYAIDIDGSGAIYVAGITGSTYFTTVNPYQMDMGYADAFITRFSGGPAPCDRNGDQVPDC